VICDDAHVSDGQGGQPSVIEGQVGTGFQAVAAGDWRGARDAFSAVLDVAEVPEALFGLANVLFWLGDIAGSIAHCEKAYAAFRRRGDPMFAAGAALSLVGYNKGYLGNTAAARGWLSRAARIIEDEVPELRGELLGATAYVTDDPVQSEALARQAAEIGRANGNSDLELMAMHAVGQALVQQGRVEDGMLLLDEAMAGVIGGEGRDPTTVAQLSCMTMVVCGSCLDLERATQWVRSLERFIDRYGCPFLYAECRTYYGRVLFENGDWAAAERLLTEAISMSRGVFPAPHAFASGTLAELRLAQGRIEEAALVLRGVEGREDAAAAVASLHLLQGEPLLATAVLRRRLAATSPDRLDVAAVIELLGEAEIALLDNAAAVERGAPSSLSAPPMTATSWSRTASAFSGTRSCRRTSPPPARTWRQRSRRSSRPGFPTGLRRHGCCSPGHCGRTVRWWPGPRHGPRSPYSRIWGRAARRTPPPR
jgi:tetratricopeptide (TPR) repeat protein